MQKQVNRQIFILLLLFVCDSIGLFLNAARHLANLGGSVVLVGRNESRLNKVAVEIKSAGSTAPLPIVADVTKDAQRIIAETIQHFGRLDVLINNAGINMEIPIMDATDEQFNQIFNTNVRSVITLCKLAVPFLEKTKGNIVNVSRLKLEYSHFQYH